MKLRIEAAIDLDANRKVWITGEAEDFNVEETLHVAASLAEAVANRALETYGKAGAAIGIIAPSAEAILASTGAGGLVPPSERRPRPEDPESMKCFGEDDDEDNAPN